MLLLHRSRVANKHLNPTVGEVEFKGISLSALKSVQASIAVKLTAYVSLNFSLLKITI